VIKKSVQHLSIKNALVVQSFFIQNIVKMDILNFAMAKDTLDGIV
jgi:hypothetical protein